MNKPVKLWCVSSATFTSSFISSGQQQQQKKPGTIFSVLRRPGTKPLSDWQTNVKNCNLFTLFSLLSHGCIPGIAETGCQNPVPARPVGKWQNSVLARSVARFWACPVVPLSRDNEGTYFPLSQKVALSRPVVQVCTLIWSQMLCWDHDAVNFTFPSSSIILTYIYVSARIPLRIVWNVS